MFVLKAAKVEVPFVKNIEKQKRQNWSGDMSTVSVQFWFNVNSDSLKLKQNVMVLSYRSFDKLVNDNKMFQ